MEVITHGEVGLTSLPVTGGVSIKVRAPGLRVAWRSVEAVPELQALGEDGGSDWDRAIAENDLEPYAAMAAQPIAVESVAMPSLAMPDSEDAFVEMRATPPPGEGLLVMVESDGVVQWYLPTNAPQVAMATAALEAVGTETPGASAELHFMIPQSTLARGSALGMASLDAETGGAIVRFLRFKIVEDLLGAAVEKVIAWIAEKVEAKNKKEGFRFFESENNFPYLTDADLQQLSGQRVLLLTHGIFSSLAGAFAGISAPANPVLQHLRGIYGRNIIGWDHWTVSKTPLENATELLAKLPPNLQPDIVCHSRGALVTRAMLEHPDLEASRATRFSFVGKAVFVAGACQGSQLANFASINRLLNVYSAIGSIPALGSAGVVLNVIVGVLRVLAHGATRLPSLEALSSDLSKNTFLQELNNDLTTPTGEIIVMHANYDPANGPLAGLLDLNLDTIFSTANDMVVPYTGAEVFDKWQQVGTNLRFGTASQTQPVVMHTNFFFQPGVQQFLQSALV
ncbi:MAG TPA: hypothetical protein VF173_02635 [Thermoanaerobaculia bacterium]|nr:hypothetical protein [Thermoanaerobaculia bacterium]